MGIDDLSAVLRQQDGVIARAQVLAAGLEPHDLRRLVRQRRLVRVHPRVYVDHTGSLTWRQRAWAAVLWAEPAALSHETAVEIGVTAAATKLSKRRSTIHVAVAADRHLPDPPGVRVHRMHEFASRVQHLALPRIRLEEALLDLAAEARNDTDAIATLADPCGAGRTTGERLLVRARARKLLPRRRLLEGVLADIATGTCSALERAYLDNVVRAHGLPEGLRQESHRHAGNVLFRDVVVRDCRLCVELDGRLFHADWGARDADMDRDLDAVVEEELLTVRLSWGQSTERACRTAARLGELLDEVGQAS